MGTAAAGWCFASLVHGLVAHHLGAAQAMVGEYLLAARSVSLAVFVSLAPGGYRGFVLPAQ